MVLFGVCVLGMAILFTWDARGGYNDVGDYLGAGFVGALLGALLGLILITIVGALLPYKSEVVQTQTLVMVKDAQGVHPGFCVTSGESKDSGTDTTKYFYYYQVSGGYNPGVVDTTDGTVVIQQNATGECVLTHRHTVWTDSWFQYLGIEFQSNRYEFMLAPGTYQPSDQLGS